MLLPSGETRLVSPGPDGVVESETPVPDVRDFVIPSGDPVAVVPLPGSSDVGCRES